MRALLALFIVSLVVACSPEQEHRIKDVTISEDVLEDHSSTNPYQADVTRSGTIYRVPGSVDPSIIDVVVADNVPFSTLAKRFDGVRSDILIGTLSDLSDRDFGFPDDAEDDPDSEAKCDPKVPGEVPLCNCTGKRDCNDMNKAGLCHGGSNISASCGKDAAGKWGCTCMRKGG